MRLSKRLVSRLLLSLSILAPGVGFSALAAGYEGSEPYQYFIGKQAYFWSYDETVADSEIARALYYNKGEFTRYGITRENGLSVRCIKDQ